MTLCTIGGVHSVDKTESIKNSQDWVLLTAPLRDIEYLGQFLKPEFEMFRLSAEMIRSSRHAALEPLNDNKLLFLIWDQEHIYLRQLKDSLGYMMIGCKQNSRY